MEIIDKKPAPKYILYFGADFFLHAPGRGNDQNTSKPIFEANTIKLII